MIDLSGMVHADYPFGPGEIFDPRANVCELPVEQRCHALRLRVEQNVLRAEVSMNEYLTRSCDPPQRVGRYPLHHRQEFASEAKYHVSVACVDQFLSVHALDERHP